MSEKSIEKVKMTTTTKKEKNLKHRQTRRKIDSNKIREHVDRFR